MAVTSIWPIKGRVDKVIGYAKNPDKVSDGSLVRQAQLHAIDGVVEYTANEMKTERMEFVSFIGCSSIETAAKDFMETKSLYGKTGGRVCYHAYQSFAEGEVTASQAHEIGKLLAEELWGDRFQVVIATHCNTNHYHNHFVINSVSDIDGYKFYNSPEDYRRMREVSDRLCREHGLSVIRNPQGKRKNYSEWSAEKNDKPTVRGMIRADIDDAIRQSVTARQFYALMEGKGYSFRFYSEYGNELTHPTIKGAMSDRNIRLDNLGSGYSPEEINARILENYMRADPIPEDGVYERRRKRDAVLAENKHLTGLQKLYFRYCYELHIIERHPVSNRRVPFAMKDDIRKLDSFDAQLRLLTRENIKTAEDLSEYMKLLNSRYAEKCKQRQDLRNELKRAVRADDTEGILGAQKCIDALNSELKEYRREMAMCHQIEERSMAMSNSLDELDIEEEKEERNDEHIQRRSRTSRENLT